MVQKIPALVINLDRASNRWAHMTKLGEQIGVEFERMSAVDAQSDWFNNTFSQHRYDYFGNPISLGDIACAESHKKSWRRFLEGDFPAMAIFEDDVFVSKDMATFLAGTDWIPEDADVIRLNYWSGLHSFSRKTWRAPENRTMRLLNRLAWNADGYILTRKGAEKMLAGRSDLIMANDPMIYSDTPERLITYQVIPSLCVQSDNASENMRMASLGSDIDSARAVLGQIPQDDSIEVQQVYTLSEKLGLKLRIILHRVLRSVRNILDPSEIQIHIRYKI